MYVSGLATPDDRRVAASIRGQVCRWWVVGEGRSLGQSLMLGPVKASIQDANGFNITSQWEVPQLLE